MFINQMEIWYIAHCSIVNFDNRLLTHNFVQLLKYFEFTIIYQHLWSITYRKNKTITLWQLREKLLKKAQVKLSNVGYLILIVNRKNETKSFFKTNHYRMKIFKYNIQTNRPFEHVWRHNLFVELVMCNVQKHSMWIGRRSHSVPFP